AELADVVGDVDGADLGEAELCAGVEEAGVDVQAGGVDDAGAGGRGGVRAGRDDAAVLDDDVAGEGGPGDRVHGPAADDERLLSGSGGCGGEQRGRGEEAAQRDHRTPSCVVVAGV